MEVVVSSLPPMTVDSSLYTEGVDGMRVLTTRYRQRAVREDTREAVRVREARLNELRTFIATLERETQVIEQNLHLLSKLENFTAASMQQLAEKGMLNPEAVIGLTKFVMEDRNTKATRQVKIAEEIQQTRKQIEFVEREIREISAGASKTERDAVIVIDKQNAAAGTVRLSYLVNNAGWQPTYRVRMTDENRPVQLEYLAAVTQQSGEDWSGVNLVLSNAQPMLNAAPPDLLALNVSTIATRPDAPQIAFDAKDNIYRSREMRQQAQQEFNRNKLAVGNAGINSAAALEQSNELLSGERLEDVAQLRGALDGPSVTYRLRNAFTLPSRSDSQLVEVARLEVAGDFYYKTVPVLSPHVYRLADLKNSSEMVLLAGEATVYMGSDFVGRMTIPLVAIGESFTAGFGVDPQLQVERTLISRNRNIQGGNQVQVYDYRIRVSSYKAGPVRLQVWDRMPVAEGNAVGVSLISSNPSLSTDATYLRTDRPKNLLRWDLVVEPGAHGEKAAAIEYSFKLEYDRSTAISSFEAK
jgi:uncharacterized protein (TIGR02231 family)